MKEIENFLLNELNKNINNNSKGIDNIIKICESYYDKPANNITELKKRNTKLKGDIFECFSKIYLLKIYKLKNVWYYFEIPDNIKKNLNLSKNDMGIDLLGIDDEDRYYAIQAKYRKRPNSEKKISITWKQLSTFYALCLNSGPYHKHIIITTADYVRHIGKKSDKDITINYNKLSKIDHFSWIDFYNYNKEICKKNKSKNDNILNEDEYLDYKSEDKILLKDSDNKITKEEVRLKRIEYFKNLDINSK